MKRLILIVLLLCGFSVMCFANGSLEFFGGLPLNWEKGKIFGYEADTNMTSLSIGLGFVSPINERIAFGVYDEFIYPQKLEIVADGKETSVGRDAYNTLMGMSVLLAPVFYLYSDEEGRIKIPLVTGIRWMWLSGSTDYTALFGSNFGLGVGIGAELKINEKLKIFGRLMGIYDFYSISSITTSGYSGTKTEEASGTISSFGFTPHIGLGITF
jgi:hypothetical protein